MAGLADTPWYGGRLANGTALEPLSAWAADQEVVLESMAFPGHFVSAGSQVRNSYFPRSPPLRFELEFRMHSQPPCLPRMFYQLHCIRIHMLSLDNNCCCN